MSRPLGYQDTPILPGTPWHVHDGQRPQPRVVTPPTPSTQEAAGNPPSDAIVLFNGSDLAAWTHKDGSAPKWTVESGHAEVAPRTGDIFTKQKFGNIHLHVEWRAPDLVKGEGQGRGNSGVFLMGAYEIQVLDCYQNQTYPDGTTGAIYGQYPPLVNACRAPGQWQTYDIFWIAPVFEGQALKSPAFVTVIHNGILLHLHKPLRGPTSHKVVTEYKPHDPTGPIQLQDHGDLVRYRNIWVRTIGTYDQP